MDLLSDILALLEVQGTLYFRTSFSPRWGVKVPAFGNVARFHHVRRGGCWFSVAGVKGERRLKQGDLVIIPHGREHVLMDSPGAPVRHVDQIVKDSGFTGKGVLVYGGNEDLERETQLVCGHFAFAPDATHPLLEALPPFIHIRDAGDLSNQWLDVTLRLLGSVAGKDIPGNNLIALKLAEAICVQAIRAHLASGETDQVVFRALRDRHISQALQAIHEDCRKPWTLESMASAAGLSRTVFAERFRELMGMTPMQYLTLWRMQKARRLLAQSNQPLVRVAEQSGYLSEAAFARAFKHHFAKGPGAYRREHLSAAS